MGDRGPPRKPWSAWGKDGRTVVPYELGIPVEVPEPKPGTASDPAWWTQERRDRQREVARRVKSSQRLGQAVVSDGGRHRKE